MLGKQIVDSGRLGQITFVHTYWYQHATAGAYPPVVAAWAPFFLFLLIGESVLVRSEE